MINEQGGNISLDFNAVNRRNSCYFGKFVTLHCKQTVGKYILREKSLAIYFGDSQFKRNRIFNFMIYQIYKLTNIYK